MKDQVAPGTLCDQERAFEMFIRHIGKDMPIAAVSARHAESFIAARLASGLKISTVNKDIRTLKRMFNLAIDPRNYLLPGQNPFARIKQRKQSTKPIRFVTVEEFKTLLETAPSVWWKALLLVAYTTGARLGEILNLRWEDVDFGEGRIRIARKEAAGDSLGWEPKDHEGRVLPLPIESQEWLARLRLGSAKGSPYVFVPPGRWAHIQKAMNQGRWHDGQSLLNNLNRRLATLRKRAGVAPFSYHDLRRSCITNWARHLPAHVVQKLAGHSDIKTTQRYYLSVQSEDLERAKRIQSMLLGEAATDPKLTHSGQNEAFCEQNAKEAIA